MWNIVSALIALLVGLWMARRYGWSHPKLWGLTGVPASVLVGRLVELDTYLGLQMPKPLVIGCLVLAIVLAVSGLAGFALNVDQAGRSMPAGGGTEIAPRPPLEMRYAIERDKAAWSDVLKIWLWLEDDQAPKPPPKPGLEGLFTAMDPPAPPGKRIWAAFGYHVILENSGQSALHGFQITIDFDEPYRTTDAERIVELAKVGTPVGARCDLARTGDATLSGTCDLLNPQERVEVRFYTTGPMGRPLRQAKLRVAVRFPNLPPLVECPWPTGGEHRLEPAKPAAADEPALVPRAAPLVWAGRGVNGIARVLLWLGRRVQLLALRVATKRPR